MNLTDTPQFDETAHVTPPCAHFGECGGCQLQHINDATYQSYKTQIVIDLLHKNNIKPARIHDTIFIPQGVRRRVTFVCERKGTNVIMGFNQRRSHDIVPIDTCLLMTPALQSSFDRLKISLHPILKDNARTDIFLQDIGGDIEMVITGAINRDRPEPDLLKHMAQIAEQCGLARIGVRKTEFDMPETMISLKQMTKDFSGLNVTIPMGAFLQPSDEGETTLVNIVLNHLPQKKKIIAMDLFAGCGTFTGALLPRVAQVMAYELDQLSVDCLQKSLAGRGKSYAEQRHLFQEPVVAREMKNVDVVVLDPPRAGAKEQSQTLAKSNVPLVIYVSCNPQSFVRDADILARGGYVCSDIYAVDQFKWSSHMEVVGIFHKNI
jgi:23S rRNA (uracil1939-C5)-methyltransferase